MMKLHLTNPMAFPMKHMPAEPVLPPIAALYRNTDRETDRQRDRDRQRQTERQIDRDFFSTASNSISTSRFTSTSISVSPVSVTLSVPSLTKSISQSIKSNSNSSSSSSSSISSSCNKRRFETTQSERDSERERQRQRQSQNQNQTENHINRQLNRFGIIESQGDSDDVSSKYVASSYNVRDADQLVALSSMEDDVKTLKGDDSALIDSELSSANTEVIDDATIKSNIADCQTGYNGSVLQNISPATKEAYEKRVAFLKPMMLQFITQVTEGKNMKQYIHFFFNQIVKTLHDNLVAFYQSGQLGFVYTTSFPPPPLQEICLYKGLQCTKEFYNKYKLIIQNALDLRGTQSSTVPLPRLAAKSVEMACLACREDLTHFTFSTRYLPYIDHLLPPTCGEWSCD